MTPGGLLCGLAAGLILSVLISAGVWALAQGIDSKIRSEGTWFANFCEWLYETPISVGIRESLWFGVGWAGRFIAFI